MKSRRSILFCIALGALSVVGGIIVAPTAFGQSKHAPASRPTSGPAPLGFVDCDKDEYAVFTAVLKHRFIDHKQRSPRGGREEGPEVTQFVVGVCTLDCRIGSADPRVKEHRDELREDSMEVGWAGTFRDAAPELEQRFTEVNRKPGRIEVKKIQVGGLEIVPFEQSDYLTTERPPLFFYRKYPRSQGISLFSRVAFSRDGKQACVSLSTREGQFGYGDIFWLRLENGVWRVIDSKMSWIT